MPWRQAIACCWLLVPLLSGCQAVLSERAPALSSQSHPSPTRERGEPAIESPTQKPPVKLASHQETKTSPSDLPPQTPPASGQADSTAESRPDSLTLADLESMALGNSPTLVAAVSRIQGAHGKQIQAGLYPNPVVGYHATEIGNLGTAGQQGGFVSQRFITGGKRQLDQAIAGKEIDELRFRLRAQEQRVLSDVRVRFYEVLVAQRRSELSEQLTRIGDDLVAATEMLLASRQGSENDLLQAEIRADESRILRDNAENETAEAWRRLAVVIGCPNLPRQTLAGPLHADLPSLDWEACCDLVLSGHPELEAAQARIARAAIAVRRARREPIPDVDVSVSVRHHNVTQSEVANVQVGVPIPIFNQHQGHILTTQSEWVAATTNARRIELDLQDRLAVAYRRYSNATQQVDRYRQRILPRASESLRLVTAGYELGQVPYLNLLTAQQTYIQANLSYLNSLRELRTAMAMIQSQLLTGSLAN